MPDQWDDAVKQYSGGGGQAPSVDPWDQAVSAHQANQPQHQPNLRDWTDRLGGGVVQQAKDLGNSALGLVPRKGPDGKWDAPTAHAILNLTTGLAGKASGHPLSPEADQAATQFMNQYKDRYGSWDGFKNALANDPASVLGDAVGLATGVSGLAEGGALAAERAGLSGVADTARGLSPIRQGANAAINVGKGVSKAMDTTSNALGKVIDTSGGRAATLATGAENATEIKPWDRSFQLASQAVNMPANGQMADVLYKALPLVKAQEGTARDLSPYISTPNIGPVGKVPIKAKFAGVIPYLKGNASDFLQTLDHVEATTNAKSQLWNQYEQEYLLPHRLAGTQVNAQPILDAVNSAPSEYVRRANPGALNSAQERATRIYSAGMRRMPGINGTTVQVPIPRMMSTDDLQAALRGINAEKDAFAKQAPGVQQAALDTNPIMIGLNAEGDAVRKLLYTTLGNGDESVPRDMMAHYGALTQLQDATIAQLNGAIAHDPGGLKAALPYMGRATAQAKMGEFRGAFSNASQAIVKGFTPAEGTGWKLTKALDKLELPPAQWAPPKPIPGAKPGAPPPPPRGMGAGPGSAVGPYTGPQSGMSVQHTPLLGPGAPPAELPPAVIGPKRQLPAAAAPGGPAIPMPGGPPPVVPEPPPFPQNLLGPDSSGPIPPTLPQNYVLPNLPPPPTAARGASVMGIPKPPSVVKPPSGPSAEVRRERVRNQFRGAKQRLDRQFMGMAKGNKTGSYGVPPGVLTDQQSTQYNGAVRDLLSQQNNELAQIPDDMPNGPMAPVGAPMPPGVVPIPAAGGVTVNGPSPVIVGEPGPERIDHSDGRPPEVVSGTQVVNLGQNGSTDKVTPLTPFPAKGIIRGSANIPLSPEGQQTAMKLGQQLAKAGGMDKVYSSDLSRTQETAQHIAQATGAQVMPPTPGLRSWALGYLEGQPGTDGTDQIIAHHINAVPDEPVPGQGPVSTQPGESFNQFKGRVIPTVQGIVQEQEANPHTRVNIVTHNRDEKLIRAWLHAGGGADIDKRVFDEEGGDPGSMSKIVKIAPGKYRVEDYDPSKTPTLPGVYLTRHAQTGWNAPKGGGGS